MDEKKLNRLVQTLYDASNRGLVAGTVGAPVDASNALLALLGLGSKKPVMGTEWIGDRMQDAGMVSNQRNPFLENLMIGVGAPLGAKRPVTY